MKPADASLSDGAGEIRVILVGRTGVDGALRRDPAIELIRARTPLDAIGELADPIDHESPANTAVIVAPDVISPAETKAFLLSLREIDPRISAIIVDDPARPDGFPVGRDGAFDAALAVASDGAELRRLMSAGRAERPAVAPEMRADAGPVPAREQSTTIPAPTGDEQSAVNALLSGHDPVGPFVSMLRVELGAPDLTFQRAAEQTATGPGVEVRRSGHLFGLLSSPTLGSAALAAAAERLAAWLALCEQHEQLRVAAFTDPLTGAWNRRYFDRILPMALERARQRRHEVTLLVFDIDDFKVYNDQFGHGAGDEILRESVRLLNCVIRPTDRVCRIGGDEFAVVFDSPEGPRTTGDRRPLTISDIALRFQKQICAHHFPKLGEDAPTTLTISGGLATFPWDAHTAEGLLERADGLAIESKRLGKNVIRFGPGALMACAREDAASGDSEG